MRAIFCRRVNFGIRHFVTCTPSSVFIRKLFPELNEVDPLAHN